MYIKSMTIKKLHKVYNYDIKFNQDITRRKGKGPGRPARRTSREPVVYTGDGVNMPSRSGRQRSLPLRHWGLAKRVPGTWGQVSRRTGASQRDRPALGVLRGLEGSGISLMVRAAHAWTV